MQKSKIQKILYLKKEEKTINFQNVIIFIKSVFNKDNK